MKRLAAILIVAAMMLSCFGFTQVLASEETAEAINGIKLTLKKTNGWNMVRTDNGIFSYADDAIDDTLSKTYTVYNPNEYSIVFKMALGNHGTKITKDSSVMVPAGGYGQISVSTAVTSAGIVSGSTTYAWANFTLIMAMGASKTDTPVGAEVIIFAENGDQIYNLLEVTGETRLQWFEIEEASASFECDGPYASAGEKTPHGIQFKLNASATEWTYMRTPNNVFTSADVTDGKLKKSYIVYNPNDFEISARVLLGSGGSALSGTFSSVSIPAKSFGTISFSVSVTNGAVPNGSATVALNNLTLMFHISATADGTLPGARLNVFASAGDQLYKVIDHRISAADKSNLYTVVAPNASNEIVGASLNIGSSLTLNYFAELDEAHSSATLKVTRNNKETVISGVYDKESGYYKYSYTGINPQCMTDNIKAELILNGEVISSKDEYSVKSYCDNLKGKTALELKITEEKYALMVTLMSDMLLYGDEAQKYTGYRINDLASTDLSWVTERTEDFVAPAGVRAIDGNEDEDNKVIAMGLNMSNVNKIYFRLHITDENVVIRINGVEATEINENGCVYTEDIVATDFDKIYTLELEKGGDVISTVKYDVNSYIARNFNDEKVGSIVKALHYYGASAQAYGN